MSTLSPLQSNYKMATHSSSNNASITSRGCCKLSIYIKSFLYPIILITTHPNTSSLSVLFIAKSYILCVLHTTLNQVHIDKQLTGHPFPINITENILDKATCICERGVYSGYFTHGTQFNLSNPKTYWTKPLHFNTW